jgi:dihydroorotate dehydrogenase (NAD+) catalytic subunit
VRRVIRDHGAAWERSFVAVIAHVAGDGPGDIAAVAGVLEDLPGVAGLEVDVPSHDDPRRAADLIWAAREAADLPVLARLSLDAPDEVVQAVLSAGADALVVAQPPAGAYVLAKDREVVRGGLHGPGLLPLVAACLEELARWAEVPLVACGGVHEPDDALAYLAVGASAVQVDTAAWVDPSLPGRVVQALAVG